MSASPLAPHLRAFAPDFARRFALIAAGLSAVIARGFLRNPRLVIFIIPLCARLTRAVRRCNTIMATIASGHFPRHRRPGRSGTPAACRIPETEAWLIQTLRHEAAAFRSQLLHLLADPAAAELLLAAPAAGHVLRPLCRLLGIPTTARSAVVGDSRPPSRPETPDIAPPPPTAREDHHPESARSPVPPAMPPPPCPRVGFPWFPRLVARPA